MCLAAPKTYGGFLVARFFLGVTEGAVSPAFITITSIWYKKSEHPLRIGYLAAFSAYLTAFTPPPPLIYMSKHELD